MNQDFVLGVSLVILIINFREQKRLEQTLRRDHRLSIIGFVQPLISFVYGLVIGRVEQKYYIQMMGQEACIVG